MSYFFPHEKQAIFYEKNRFFSIFNIKDNAYYWLPYKLGLEPFKLDCRFRRYGRGLLFLNCVFLNTMTKSKGSKPFFISVQVTKRTPLLRRAKLTSNHSTESHKKCHFVNIFSEKNKKKSNK